MKAERDTRNQAAPAGRASSPSSTTARPSRSARELRLRGRIDVLLDQRARKERRILELEQRLRHWERRFIDVSERLRETAA